MAGFSAAFEIYNPNIYVSDCPGERNPRDLCLVLLLTAALTLKSMKPFVLSSSLFLSSLILSAGCVNTTSLGDEPGDSPVRVAGRLHVRLVTGDYTRASSEAGTAEEDAVSSLHLAFYCGDSFLGVVEAEKTDGGYEADVPSVGASRPDKVIAYANLDASSVAAIGCPLDNLRSLTSGTLSVEGKGFVMSASRLKSDEGAEVYYTPLSVEDYMDDSGSVEMRVERLAAKVTLDNKVTAFQSLVMGKASESNTRTLNLTVDGWGLTAVERSSRLIRQTGDMSLGDWYYSGSDMACHWARSVSWDARLDFPAVGEDIVESTPLHYLRYSEAGNGFGTSLYEHETTRPAGDYVTDNALASVVIRGRYTIDGMDDGITFYRYGDGIYTEEELWTRLLELTKGVFYTDSEGAHNDIASIKENTVLAHASGTPSNMFTLRLSDKVTSGVVAIYDANKVAVDSYEAIDGMLAKHVGYVEKFDGGRCAFVVPVRHMAYDSDADVQPEGAYGLVRNHHYRMALESIEGMGSGIASDADYVLESGMSSGTPSYKIGITLSVMPWTLLEQSVNIKK